MMTNRPAWRSGEEGRADAAARHEVLSDRLRSAGFRKSAAVDRAVLSEGRRRRRSRFDAELEGAAHFRLHESWHAQAHVVAAVDRGAGCRGP